MKSSSAVTKQYTINVTVNLKRGREEIEFAKSETTALHNLISNNIQIEWAKDRIEKIHQMIFMPSAEQMKNELAAQVKQLDQEDEGSTES